MQEHPNEVPFLMNFQETKATVVDTEGSYDESMQCWSCVLSAGSDTGTMTFDTKGSSDSDSD
jgi:hypothetical protein